MLDARVPSFVFTLVGWEQLGTSSPRRAVLFVLFGLVQSDFSCSFKEEAA